MDIAKRLLDYGFHAPTVYFPLIVKEAVMIEPTETENKATLDAFAEVLFRITEEPLETLHDAPHTTPVSRPDEVRAARTPVLKWKGRGRGRGPGTGNWRKARRLRRRDRGCDRDDRVPALDGPARCRGWNMAVDEMLLEWSAEHGGCCLRLYHWQEATLSLGYFQEYQDRGGHGPSRNCPVVRRLTGGGAIVHDAELTYSLVVHAGHPLAAARDALYHAAHGAWSRRWPLWTSPRRKRGRRKRGQNYFSTSASPRPRRK